MAVTNTIAPARTDNTVSLVLTGRHLDVTGTDLNLSFPPWPAPAKPLRKTSRWSDTDLVALRAGLEDPAGSRQTAA